MNQDQTVLRLTPHTGILQLQEFLLTRKEGDYLSVVIDHQIPVLRSHPNAANGDEACTGNASTIDALMNVMRNGSGLPWDREVRHAFGINLHQLAECTVKPLLKALEPLAHAENERQQARSSYAAAWEEQQPEHIGMKVPHYQIVRRVLAHLKPAFNKLTEPPEIEDGLRGAVNSLKSAVHQKLFLDALDHAGIKAIGMEALQDVFIVLRDIAMQKILKYAVADEDTIEQIQLTLEAISIRHKRILRSETVGSSPKKTSLPFARPVDAPIARTLFPKGSGDHVEQLPPRTPSPSRKGQSRQNGLGRYSQELLSPALASTPRKKHRNNTGSESAPSEKSEYARKNRRSMQSIDFNPLEKKKGASAEKALDRSRGAVASQTQSSRTAVGNELSRLYAGAPSSLKFELSKTDAIRLHNFFEDLGELQLGEDKDDIATSLNRAVDNQEYLTEQDGKALLTTIRSLLDLNKRIHYKSVQDLRLKICLQALVKKLELTVARYSRDLAHSNTSNSHNRAVEPESSENASLSDPRSHIPRSPSSKLPDNSTETTPPSALKQRKKNRDS